MHNGFNGFSNFNNRSPLRTLVNPQEIRRSWRSGGPVITGTIIVACAVMWLIEIILRFLAPEAYMAVISEGVVSPSLALINPWRIFTSMFLHATNVLHVLFNMMALWSVGPLLERLMGHWQYGALYLISGMGGAVGLTVWAAIEPTYGWYTYALGASGAIFGLFGAVMVVFRRVGADIRPMLIWIGLNFLMPFVISGIAWQAHVGGFVTGIALTELLTKGIPRLRRTSVATRMWIYGSVIVVTLIVVTLVCNLSNPLL
ncbi:rhomboid family intramembrane serine protease [Bifidobacterium aquikefiricola]|uniref:Rhomboid family intramembrane serine protease n=1 Tax=Bifidobacterium aquikefiricola TaxID=3059038 RepID=A0AB39U7C0_9BIFI